MSGGRVFINKKIHIGNPLAVPWLGLHTFTAEVQVQSLVELGSRVARYGKKEKYIIELGTKTPLFVDLKQVQLPEDGSRN